MTASISFIGAFDVLGLVVAICLATFVSVATYRAMQRPRLRLTRTPTGQWRAGRRDVVRYLLTIPVLLGVWVTWLFLILLFGVNNLTGAEVVQVACAVVLASRTLAHLSLDHAHELAKSVPLTLVTLLIIGGGLRSPEALKAILTQMQNTSVSVEVFVALLATELALTAAWYWIGVRWLAIRGWRVPGIPTVPAL